MCNWILYEKCFLLRYCMLKWLKNYQIWNFRSSLSNFWYIFNFRQFFCNFLKKILKKGQMSLNWCHLSGEHDFWTEFGSRAKIDRGAPGAPPQTWQALSDVKLVRVKPLFWVLKIVGFCWKLLIWWILLHKDVVNVKYLIFLATFLILQTYH